MKMQLQIVSLILFAKSTPSEQSKQYQHYRLESLCGGYQDKQTIFLKSQPAVITFSSRNYKQIRCHLELRLSSEYFGFSVYTEVMKLENSKGCVTDFLQFGRDFIIFTSFKSPKRCGTIAPTQRILRENGSLLQSNHKERPQQEREYIEAEDDEMDIWLEIHPPEHNQSSKELKLIVTPFKKVCSKNDYLYKQCPSSGKCIKRELFCDGVINCDGEEKEEEEEYCLQNSIQPGSGFFYSISGIIIFVIVAIIVIMAIIIVFKIVTSYCKIKLGTMETTEQRRATSTRQHQTQSRTDNSRGSFTSRGTVPPTGTVIPRGTISPRGTVTPRETFTPRGTVTPRGPVTPISIVNPRQIPEYDPRPSAPVMSMGDEGPYMSPLPPSYNDVMGMGIGFREEPPKYSE